MKMFRLFVAFTLSFALSPSTQAVVPPPDGGYPNFTTAEGQNALHTLTTGSANTALGAYSLFSTTTASFNTAVGAGALDLNTGDNNTAVGVASLLLNSGTNNTANGTAALEFNDSGSNSTANGAFALFSNTTGTDNTAVGWSALAANTDGCGHVAVGLNALLAATAGCSIFAANTAVGTDALASNTTGTGNTAIGFAALLGNTTGSFNTVIGNSAGSALTTGDHNICIGAGVVSQAGLFNTIRIGDNLPNGPGESICMIGGIWAQAVAPTGSPVFVDSDGKLGVAASSQRFKHDIKPMDKVSEAILALKPVTFHYKSDTKNTPCYGLIAEEVEKVNPALVLPDNKGKPYTVRYDAVNAMLLNEFLKEHQKVQNLEATVASLVATVKEQASQIQKVNAQLELSKPAPQTVLNNR